MTDYDFNMSEEEFKQKEIINEFNESFDKVLTDFDLIYDKIDEIKEIEGDRDWENHNQS